MNSFLNLPAHTLLFAFTALLASAHAAEPAFDLMQALQELSASGTQELRIPAGRYRLPAGGVRLEKLKNVKIQASGVTWVATDLSTAALQLEKCENVEIHGLTIDYDPLPFTQGTVTAVDFKAMTVDFEVHAGYPELSDAYLEQRQMHLFEKASHRWQPGAPDYYPKKIEPLSPRTGRITFPSKTEGADLIQAGSRLALTIRKKNAIQVRVGCKGILFENVTLHAAPGIGILVRFAEEAGTYRNVRVIPGPLPTGATEQRLLSTSADAFNAAYCRRGPIVEKCDFSYMGDDGINLHGTMLPVLQWRDERTLVAMPLHRGEPFDHLIRPGDEIRFLQEPAYAITASTEVESIKVTPIEGTAWLAVAEKIWPDYEQPSKPTFYEIRLKAPVSGVNVGDFLEVPALNTPGFVIKDSSFHDHRARGLRVMASDGEITNNRFERLRGSAITIGGEFAFWREAGWCHNIAVRGNQITSICEGLNNLLPNSYTSAAISLFARVKPEGAATKYFQGHEDIQITHNRIDGCPVNGIQVVAAKKVLVSNNALLRVNLKEAPKAGADYGLAGQQSILVIQSDVALKDNNFIKE